MPLAYLVMGRYAYYTDEFYAFADGDGSGGRVTCDPRRVFYDRAEAETFAERLNLLAFDGFTPSHWCIDPSDITPLGAAGAVARLREIVGDEHPLPPDADFWTVELPAGLPDDTLRRVAELFPAIRQYIVVEAEVEDPTPLDAYNAAYGDAPDAPSPHGDADDFTGEEDPERVEQDRRVSEAFGVHYIAPEERF